MSQRNGDKARFHRMRRKRIIRRERQRIQLGGEPEDARGGKASSGKRPVKPASSQ
jgi:hypothetical protein